ncbi:MAG: hypothetical protein AB1635_07030 [Acidobacteriota bacterium]
MPTPSRRDRQLALVVGGDTETLAAVEAALGGCAYDVEFVDYDDEPYGTVLAMRPDVVIVDFGPDEAAAFQLLGMMQTDDVTRRIPVLSYVPEAPARRVEPAAAEGPGGLGEQVMPWAPSLRRH